ncbi:hypothetical protein [Streptomyces fulvoviolaceus]|uniref:hypothetical protein n=1 Tax=Streptomyces fulvoviolaceus TaxID=285535 RepID=UPI0021BE3F12|nr:hypothetical protein [Streptomyces fulvoviolaceus]MCT9079421.1 hypothetical protein [Streptomyces fulvoviolaceus]
MTSTTAPRHHPRKALLGVLAVATAAGLTLGAVPAEAATAAKKCGSGPANCALTKVHPQKGNVKVTVDNYGGNKSYLYGWDIRHAGKIVCTGEVREAWKAKTFACKNMPKGKLKLTVSYEKNTSISMKW